MIEKERFSGKTILVTGAGGNIGLAVASRFAEEGASVALLDLKGLEEAKNHITGLGCRHVEAYVCDVTDYQAVSDTVEKVVKDFGRIDMLFNNAGYQGDFKKIHEYPADDFQRVIQINTIGAFHVLQRVSAHMVNSGGGAIVNTASMAGVEGPPNMVAYGASKFAMIGMTETASKDLAPFAIRVNSIAPAFMGPGYMWTRQVEMQAAAGSQYFAADPKAVAQQMIGQVPMRRYGDINEIPGTVVFLMSDEASYITGVNIPIAGGIL